MNNLFKRESKDTLRTNTRSSPSTTSSPVLSKAQPSLLQDALSRNNNSFQTSDGSSSSLATFASAPILNKSILKQNRGNGVAPPIPNSTRPVSIQQQQYNPTQPQQYNNVNSNSNSNSNSYNNIFSDDNGYSSNQHNNPNYLPPTTALAAAGLTRPASPFAMVNSSRSSGVRDTINSVSSTHRSSRNSSPVTDPNYDLTQSDLTLDGLAQRWYAYQAMMKKRYAEDPFYKRWTKSKWILLLTTILLFLYSTAILVISVGYMTHKFELSAITMEFHSNLIYLALAGSIVGIACALIGLVGIFTENRMWLSLYTLLLWPGFALYVSVGYIAFRRAHSHLRAHVKDEWIKTYSRDQRLIVQRNLKCCGFQDASWYAEYDLRCFPMTVLPGCQHKYNLHEYHFLSTVWTIAFSIVPAQLFVMIAALLCSNHVDGMFRSARPGLKSFKQEKKD
ncbi:hypothetical protein BGX27_003019 [Mortierella sp. AM989]|nr:hypothetical protein BGX27_003019 [Mortierella sp. AM989]